MLATMLARSEVPNMPKEPSGKDGQVISVDGELTSLSWLQKPGVLTSMCTALTGSPHHVNKLAATRALRRPRQNGAGTGKEGPGKAKLDSERMFNVILNVRNKKYNGEDAQKPPLSFACMIFMSLESSPTKTLPVKEIYDWIQWKFPFYRSAPAGWKNSVRHNLSLNKCFKKVTRGMGKVSCECVSVVYLIFMHGHEYSLSLSLTLRVSQVSVKEVCGLWMQTTDVAYWLP